MADVIDSAVAAFTQWASSEAGEAAIKAAVDTVVKTATDAVVKSISGKPKLLAGTDQLSTKVGALMPISLIVGRTAVGGKLLTPTPMISGKDNRFATTVYSLAECGPSGVVESILWGDETISFDANGNAIGKYNDNLWIFQKNGAWDQSAISFAGHPVLGSSTPAAWTSTDRALGCLVVAVVVRYAAKIFASNMQTPRFVVNANAVPMIDPRTGAAVTTLAQRRNGGVVAYNWKLGWRYNNELLIGFGHATDEVHAASFAYAANVADANGWTIAGEVSANDNRYAVEVAMLQTCASFPIEKGALQGCATRALTSSVGVISSDDLRDFVSFRYKTEQSSRVNVFLPQYRSESNRWQMGEGSEISFTEWLTEDRGRRKSDSEEFVLIGSGADQAGHLMALEAFDSREPFVFMLPCKQQARYAGFAGDFITLNLPEDGIDSLKVRIINRTVNSDGTVDFEVETETNSKYSAAASKSSTPPNFTLNVGFDPGDVPMPSVGEWAAVAAQLVSGNTSLPIVRVTGSAADYPFCSGVIFKIRLNSSGSPWLESGEAPPFAGQHEFRGLTESTSYIVGVSYRGATGVEGATRELAAVTTGALVAGTAASVPWGGVSGSGRPEDDATVGAIVGGNFKFPDGSIAPIGRVDNAYVPAYDQNRVRFSRFEQALTGYLSNQSVGGLLTGFSRIVANGLAYAAAFYTVPGPGRWVSISTGNRIPVQAGERLAVAAGVEGGNADYILAVLWFDSLGALVSSNNAASSTGPRGFNERLGGFVTVPAGIVSAQIEIYCFPVGASSSFFTLSQPMLCAARADQTVLPPFSAGPFGDDGATVGGTIGTDVRLPDGSVAPIGRIDNLANPIGANQIRDAGLVRQLQYRSTIWQGVPAVPALFFNPDPNINGFLSLATPNAAALGAGNFYGVTMAKAQSYAESAKMAAGRAAFAAKINVRNPSAWDRVWARCMIFNGSGTWYASAEAEYDLVAGGHQRVGNLFDLSVAFGGILVVWGQLKNTVSTEQVIDTWEPILANVAAGQTVLPVFSVGSDSDPGADVTADAVPILEGPSSISFDVDGSGAVSPGSQLPRTLQFIRKRGSANVSASTSWSIVSAVNCTLGTITDGGVNITAIAAGNAAFTVRSVRDGVTIDQVVTVQKNTVAAGVTPPDLVRGDVIDDGSLGYASSTAWLSVLSANLPNCPGGYFQTSGYVAFGSASGDVTVEARLVVNGVQVGPVFTGKTFATGGTPEAPEMSDVFSQFLPVAAGNRTIALQFRAPSTTGSVGSGNGQLIVNVIPTD
jgi:hypothetical protein